MALTPLQEAQQVGDDVDSLTKKLEQLRTSYEKYFLGLEKREPQRLREEVIAMIRKYANIPIQNARQKFKYQQTVARYNSFTTHWDRILRQIEEGTYQRDVFRAKIHESERGIASSSSDPKPKAPGADKKASEKKPDHIQQLFDRYVSARKATNESTQGLSVDKFRKNLTGQIEAIKKKTGCATVKVNITTENGKVRLKAAPGKIPAKK